MQKNENSHQKFLSQEYLKSTIYAKVFNLNNFGAGKGYPPYSLLMSSRFLSFFHPSPHLEKFSREIGSTGDPR